MESSIGCINFATPLESMTQIYSIGIAGGHYLDIILKKLFVCVWDNSRSLALVSCMGT